MPQPATHHGEAAAPPTVRDYTRLVRNHLVVLVVSLLVGTAVSVGYLLVRTPSYVSSTSILLTATGATPASQVANGRTNTVINLDTEAQLVRSDETLEAVRARLRAVEPVRQLARRVTVTVPPNSEVLVVSFRAQEPRLAQQGSAAVADAYLDARASRARALLDAQVSALEEQLEGLHKELAIAAVDVVEANPESMDRLVAAAERDRVQSQIEDTDALLGELQRIQVTPGTVITAATPAESDSRSLTPIALVTGPFAGLLVGFGVALLLENTRRTVRDRSDVVSRTPFPVLLRLPEAVSWTSPGEWSTRQREAFSRLRNQIGHLADRPPQVVVVAGTSPGDASEAVAAGLVSSAHAPGSAPHTELDLSLMRDGRSRLHAESSGDGESDPIVVVAAPTCESSEAQTLASRSDTVLLVVEEGVSQLSHLEDAVLQFTGVGAAAIGVVLVPSTRARRAADRQVSQSGRDPSGAGRHRRAWPASTSLAAEPPMTSSGNRSTAGDVLAGGDSAEHAATAAGRS
jgi:capsular polysaccharide biosynthesis protein